MIQELFADNVRFQIFLVGLAAYNAWTFLWWELIECRLIPELRSRR